MGYYLAASLAALRSEANTRYPGRDKTSDGWIGDTSHAARASDHNPDRSRAAKARRVEGIVRAYDLDEDLDGTRADHGAELQFLVNHIVAARDPRVAYLIYEGRIWRSYAKPGIPAWTPAHYSGINDHLHHLHVSILHTAAAENDTRPWFPSVADKPPIPPVHQEDDDMPATKRIAHGDRVAYVLPDGTICDQDIDGSPMKPGSKGDDGMKAVYLTPVANATQIDRAQVCVRYGQAARTSDAALLAKLTAVADNVGSIGMYVAALQQTEAREEQRDLDALGR